VFLDVYNKTISLKKITESFAKPKAINFPCGKDEDDNLVWVKVTGIEHGSDSVCLSMVKENGNKQRTWVKLTNDELKGLRRKYSRNERHHKSSLVLQVRKKMLRIPGGKPKPIKKVFGK